MSCSTTGPGGWPTCSGRAPSPWCCRASPTAGSACWPAPGSIASPSVSRPIPWRKSCCVPSAGRSRRPSANRSGRVSPTTAAHVREELGDRVSLILDGGPCRVGVESTVLDLTGETACLLRPGGIAQAAIEAAIGPILRAQPIADGAVRLGPGMMTSHYAPGLPVRLDATDPRPGEAFLAFGPPPAGHKAGSAAVDRRRYVGGRPASVRSTARARPAGIHRHRRSCRSPRTAWAPRSTTGCAVPRPRARVRSVLGLRK